MDRMFFGESIIHHRVCVFNELRIYIISLFIGIRIRQNVKE